MGKKPEKKSAKWEYHNVSSDSVKGLTEELNKAAFERWDLVSVIYYDGEYTAFVKRKPRRKSASA